MKIFLLILLVALSAGANAAIPVRVLPPIVTPEDIVEHDEITNWNSIGRWMESNWPTADGVLRPLKKALEDDDDSV